MGGEGGGEEVGAHFAVRFMSRMSESSSNRRSSNSLIYSTH